MSRIARIKNTPDQPGFYHVICRTAGKQFLFEDDAEKHRLLLWLDKAVEFCGVELLSWCLMSNHIHLLVKVPPRQIVTDTELDRRMRILYLPKRYNAIMETWSGWQRMDGNNRRVEDAKGKLRRRMYDISWFMKTFKQAAAQDYNARHGYSGSIWGGSRFKSVYLEGSIKVLLAVAAYIHLNPVRAKMVDAAEKYAWSSWGEASAGPGRSRSGLLHLYIGIAATHQVTWAFLKSQLEDIQIRITAHRIALDDLNESRAASGKNDTEVLPLPQKLATRAAEFSSSLALGAADFIRRVTARPTPQTSPHRPHRKLMRVMMTDGVTLCTLGTRSLGRSPVAYTKAT